MREDDCGQVLGRDTFGQSKIGWDQQPIRRLVANRLHLRQGPARKVFADLELKRKIVVRAVEQVGLARFGVAVCNYQP